ncbi:MAG: hypothetical protein ACE5IR_03805 [bacterium]
MLKVSLVPDKSSSVILDKSIRAQAFWQEMKIESQKAKTSHKDAKALRDRKEKPWRILCVSAPLRALLIFVGSGLSGLGL